jgi:hypothetical protein
MGLPSWFKRFRVKADVLILEFQPHLEMIHGKYHKETSLFSALDGKFCFIFRGWTRMGPFQTGNNRSSQ